jgi:hypothetical protein
MGGSFSQKGIVVEEVLAIFPQPMPGQTGAQYCALAKKHEQKRCELIKQDLLHDETLNALFFVFAAC